MAYNILCVWIFQGILQNVIILSNFNIKFVLMCQKAPYSLNTINGGVWCLRKSQLGVTQAWYYCGISANVALSAYSVCLSSIINKIFWSCPEDTLCFNDLTARKEPTVWAILCYSFLFFVMKIISNFVLCEVFYSNTKLTVLR